MKTIEIYGKKFIQLVDPLDCVRCGYRVDCKSWGCTSSACKLTGECFENHLTGTSCPFDKDRNHE